MEWHGGFVLSFVQFRFQEWNGVLKIRTIELGVETCAWKLGLAETGLDMDHRFEFTTRIRLFQYTLHSVVQHFLHRTSWTL